MSQKRCTLTKKTQIYEQRSIGCIDRLNAIYHIRYPIYDMRYCHLSDIRYETKQNSSLCKSERTVKTFPPPLGFISPILAKVHSPRIGKRGSKISFGGISFQPPTKKWLAFHKKSKANSLISRWVPPLQIKN